MPQPQNDLSGIEILADLSAAEVADIAARCTWRRYRPQEVILVSDESDSRVLLVQSGEVRAMQFAANGNEVIFRKIAAGQVVGDFAAIDGQTRTANVVAISSCTIASLSALDFWWLLETYPRACRAQLRSLVANIRNLSQRIVEFSGMDAAHRLHAELLRLAGASEADAGPIRIPDMPTHAELAALISAQRETVTRELNRLTRLGVIRRDGHALEIQHPLALSDLEAA